MTELNPFLNLLNECHRALTLAHVGGYEVASLHIAISDKYAETFTVWQEKNLRLRMAGCTPYDLVTEVWGKPARFQLVPEKVIDQKAYLVLPMLKREAYYHNQPPAYNLSDMTVWSPSYCLNCGTVLFSGETHFCHAYNPYNPLNPQV